MGLGPLGLGQPSGELEMVGGIMVWSQNHCDVKFMPVNSFSLNLTLRLDSNLKVSFKMNTDKLLTIF